MMPSRAARLSRPLARTFSSSSSSSSPAADWSPDQYLLFDDQRTRAVHDLVHRVPLPGGRFPLETNGNNNNPPPPLRIVDLGCGPANSTAVLAARFPGARLAGVDSSPGMLARARAALPNVSFTQADLATWAPPTDDDEGKKIDLLFANAALHWLPTATRLPTILRLLRHPALRAQDGHGRGGVLAFQVPDNRHEPSHRAMRDVARGLAPEAGAGPDAPWVPYLRELHDRDDMESPGEIYDALAPHCAAVDIWHAVYQHVLPGGVADIVAWFRGSGLQPFVHALPEDGEEGDTNNATTTSLRAAFLAAYERRLAALYPTRVDGSVLLAFPRLFVVAVKK